MSYVYTHNNSDDPNDLGLVDDLLMSFLYGLRHYGYGGDVRESFSRAFERTAIMLSQYSAANERNDVKMDELIKEFQNSVGKLTDNSELINARIGLDGTVYPTLKAHLDSIEEQGKIIDEVDESDVDIVNVRIEGLSDKDSPFSYEVISSAQEEKQSLPIMTMKSQDISIQPAGGDN